MNIYLDYLTIVSHLEIAGITKREAKHTIAKLFAEIDFADEETGLEALQEFVAIYQHDNKLAMQLLEYAHKQVMRLK